MIATSRVQASILSKLKAHAPLVALVGDDIREESWQNTNYTYPCVRVHITTLAPIMAPGSCEDTAFDLSFNVSYRDEKPSSASTGDGIAVVVEALLNKKLSGTGFVARTGIVLGDVAGPVPEEIDSWMARAFFTARLQETS